MDNKFKDLFTTLCYDEPHKCFVIPNLLRQGYKPEISPEQFEKDILALWDYCERVRREFKVLHWDNSVKVLAEVIQEVFFDGNGYAIPYFGVYINEKPENQIITDIAVVPSIVKGRTEFVYTTDFAKDSVMYKFSNELYMNLHIWEQWLRTKKKGFGAAIPEFTEKINMDNYGKNIMAQPFQRKIDAIMESKKKHG